MLQLPEYYVNRAGSLPAPQLISSVLQPSGNAIVFYFTSNTDLGVSDPVLPLNVPQILLIELCCSIAHDIYHIFALFAPFATFEYTCP